MHALRQCGACVLDLSRVGQGCPDLLVGYRGVNILVEAKTAKGELTKCQHDFLQLWRGEWCIVRSVEDALLMLQAIQAGQGGR